MKTGVRRRNVDEASVLRKLDKLLWQKSWAAYKRLPGEVKVWIDLDDLHAEAQLHAIKCLRRWTPVRGSQMTFVFVGVTNHLSSLVLRLTARKRHNFDIQWVELGDADQFSSQRTLDPLVDPIVRWAYGNCF